MKYCFISALFLLLLIGCSEKSGNPLVPTSERNFSKTIGESNSDDFGESVIQTSDGGFIVAGITSLFDSGQEDVYLVKANASGNKVWAKTFGGSCSDVGHSVQQSSDGGFIIAGSTSSFGAGNSDIYLIKTDVNGNKVWEKTFGGANEDWGSSVQQSSDGGYIITGSTRSFGAGQADVYLIKTDISGNKIWEKTFGGSRSESGNSVQQTPDGGFIIAGYAVLDTGATDVYLIKTDLSGNKVWEKTFGGSTDDISYSIQQTSDNGFIVVGYTWSTGAGQDDIYLIKTDANGNLIWERAVGGSGADFGIYVRQTSDGGFIIAGGTMSYGAGQVDVYLVKIDASGNKIWEKVFGGRDRDEGHSVQQTSDGGYIITGYTKSFGAGYSDVYLIKTDSEGNVK
ncbi:MAG: hypothetical protein WCS69_02110 [Ignavibacteriaceae bacterium]